jgi:hypothetical protein
MIRVTVELVSAITGKTAKLAEMQIANVTSDREHSANPNFGNYYCKIIRKGSHSTVTRETVVLRHARVALPVWNLVQKALNQMYPNCGK